MKFDTPILLLLLIPLSLLPFLVFRRQRERAVRYSRVTDLAALSPGIRTRLNRLPYFLSVFGLAMLIVAAAGPVKVLNETRKVTEGVAIELVVDRSGSMATEMTFRDQYMRRIDIVRMILADFIFGNGKDLTGRPDDLLGMVAFARFADTYMPLTLSHDPFRQYLDKLDLVTVESEDGTSIGDALALAAARLKALEERSGEDGEYVVTSRIIILLTDGENNAGTRSPLEAAELAREWGIKVFAVGIGTGQGYMVMNTPFGAQRVPVQSSMDTAALEKIAEVTDGQFYEAEDGESLLQVYADIDAQMKSEITVYDYTETERRYHRFAIPGMLALLLAFILGETWLRRFP